MKPSRLFSAAALILASTFLAPAASHAADARFDAFVARLKPEAVRAGVSASTFDRAFRGLDVDAEAIAKSK